MHPYRLVLSEWNKVPQACQDSTKVPVHHGNVGPLRVDVFGGWTAYIWQNLSNLSIINIIIIFFEKKN